LRGAKILNSSVRNKKRFYGSLIRRIVTHPFARFRDVGLDASLAHYRIRVREMFWEWSRGVNTSGYIPSDPQHVAAGYHHYTATRIDSLIRVLRRLDPT